MTPASRLAAVACASPWRRSRRMTLVGRARSYASVTLNMGMMVRKCTLNLVPWVWISSPSISLAVCFWMPLICHRSRQRSYASSSDSSGIFTHSPCRSEGLTPDRYMGPAAAPVDAVTSSAVARRGSSSAEPSDRPGVVAVVVAVRGASLYDTTLLALVVAGVLSASTISPCCLPTPTTTAVAAAAAVETSPRGVAGLARGAAPFMWLAWLGADGACPMKEVEAPGGAMEPWSMKGKPGMDMPEDGVLAIAISPCRKSVGLAPPSAEAAGAAARLDTAAPAALATLDQKDGRAAAPSAPTSGDAMLLTPCATCAHLMKCSGLWRT
mmetsp:Transcript_15217/g.37923  ORF Transcript_15217/g.37923 Transcript_15217/m.37923 type:complete len:325 (+) Transcript_15217:409-1383(+)